MKTFGIALTVVTLLASVPAAASFESRERERLVALAMTHEGKPYVWLKNGPDAFDCSGLVHHVLERGLGPKRFPLPFWESFVYRAHFQKHGLRIDCKKAKLADIVFFPKKDRKYNHIGIITDPRNKKFITAQMPGVGVQIGTYTGQRDWGRYDPECFTMTPFIQRRQ